MASLIIYPAEPACRHFNRNFPQNVPGHTIYLCPCCGAWWFAWSQSSYDPYDWTWKRVSWCHYRLRRRIRKVEPEIYLHPNRPRHRK